MAIEVRKVKDLSQKSGVKVLLYSQSGAGKTGSLRGCGRTLMISMESGELVLADAKNVDVIRAKTVADVREAYGYIKENIDSYDTVAIDSLSELGDMIVSELKANPEYGSMTDAFKLWAAYTEIMLKIAKSFRDLDGINVVLIALEESVKSGFDEKVMPLIPAKKAQAKLPALYDEVIYININDEGKREFICQPTESIIAKDRSGKLPQTISYEKEKGLAPVFEIINT